ncbi:MAG: MATE family efflux transporter [Planctomycetota bacterium]
MLRLALPALAEETLVLMVTWTDWWLASRYFVESGDATKAAMGLMAYLMWLIPCFFSVVAIGATALIARWIGSQDIASARRAANQAYLVGIVLSLGITILVWFFGRPFISLMQLEGEAAEFANRYLNVITFVIPMIMCSQIGAACLRGAGDTVSGFVVKTIVVIVNIVVSTLLVTGWGGDGNAYWEGLAIGTASGYAIGGSILTGILVFGRAGLKLDTSMFRPDFSVLSKLFKIGLPGGFDIGTLLFSQLLFLGLINSLGQSAAAAHGLAVQIEACAFLPGVAFQVAAATMAGQFIGANMPQRATISIWQCLSVGGAIMCTGSVVLYIFGIYIASFFTGDPTNPTTQNVADLLQIVAYGLPSLAIVMIVSGGFRGAGDTKWQFYFTAIGFILIRIPLAVFLCFKSFEIPTTGIVIEGLGWGVEGAWYAMVIDLVLRSAMIMARMFHGGWQRISL